MITAAVYWAMKFQFGADWSAWCLVLPVLLDIALIGVIGRAV